MTTSHDIQDDTPSRILRVAMEQFAQHSFAGTSVRQICEAAGVNVASINYYFRSKELLYHEVFRVLFEDLGKPLEAIPDKIHDAASWRAALLEFIASTLRLITNDQPPFVWAARLLAQERTQPSSVCPMLHESFFRRGHDSLVRMLRMGLPEHADEATVIMWTSSVMAQVMVFLHRDPPWDAMLIPKNLTRDQWINSTSQHILESVTTRLVYRSPRRGKTS